MKKANTLAFTSAILLFANALLGSAAHAQSRYFEGFSLGLGVTSVDTKAEEFVGSSSYKIGDTDNNGVLQVQYNLAAGDSFLVGLGGSAYLGNLKAGHNGALGFTVNDGYSLYVAPGYAFNDTWMGYAKLAYVNAKFKTPTFGTLNFDSGTGLGLGVQAVFDRNWFGQLEYMENRYSDIHVFPGETLKLKTNVFSLTGGYRF